jgi:hypothetical protein
VPFSFGPLASPRTPFPRRGHWSAGYPGHPPPEMARCPTSESSPDARARRESGFVGRASVLSREYVDAPRGPRPVLSHVEGRPSCKARRERISPGRYSTDEQRRRMACIGHRMPTDLWDRTLERGNGGSHRREPASRQIRATGESSRYRETPQSSGTARPSPDMRMVRYAP